MVRKSKRLRPVMTRIPEGLRRKLEREAEQNGRSMNAEIIHRLESSFRREETDQKFAGALATVLGGVHDIKQQVETLTVPRPKTLLELERLPAPASVVSDVRDIKEMLQQSTNKGENSK